MHIIHANLPTMRRERPLQLRDGRGLSSPTLSEEIALREMHTEPMALRTTCACLYAHIQLLLTAFQI